MKKKYESPLAEVMDFDLKDIMMEEKSGQQSGEEDMMAPGRNPKVTATVPNKNNRYSEN